jgi:CRISPR-associated protein Csm1
MYSIEEKILILGSLFHDFGKFQQRCYSNALGKHEVLGEKYVESLKEYFIKVLDNDEKAFERCKTIIKYHHSDTNDELIKICKISDHLSASERVGKAEYEEPADQWQHQFLSSIFSKIRLLNEDDLNLRYYKHEILTKKNYKVLIPQYETKEDAVRSKAHYRNQTNIFVSFTEDLKSVLSIYNTGDDFSSLINLLLILFEKYMWCIPDFTGSPETDISLYNHSKDAAGLSHALFLNRDIENKKLTLIIGDLPGIQNYIFNVVNKKPAKILRGRSIYVQILTRIFASIFLNNFGLTECSLIMLAGGKFYIIAPINIEFEANYKKSISEIEKYLAENFYYEMKFASGYETFDCEELKSKSVTFGNIIDRASLNLLSGRHRLFHNKFINQDDFNFILKEDYYKSGGAISDKIKCAVTDIPIRKGREKKISIGEEEVTLEKQVKNEYEIGTNITRGTVIIELNGNDYEVKIVKQLKDYTVNENNKRIILNPELDKLLEYKGNKKSLLRDALFIEVANYCSFENDNVMDFDSMIKKNDGAEVLTLIKGDIDELGLIMSTGLVGDKNTEARSDYTSISRTTTLSNHLKYFFSFFMNGFLESWDVSQKIKEEIKKEEQDQYVYTIFAGGDDLMLISPQSASLKLLQEFNKQFSDFVCDNPEVHISYSLTNFKDSTPIRMVAEISEQNQHDAKNKFKNNGNNSFLASRNKAGTFLFNTVIKNDNIIEIDKWSNKLSNWYFNKAISAGTIYNLFYLAQLMKDFIFNENKIKNISSKLIWHPMLTYLINRNVKDSRGNYFSKDAEIFFSQVLAIPEKAGKSEEFLKILYPLICLSIYKIRK